MNLRRNPKKRKITDADDFGKVNPFHEQFTVSSNSHTNIHFSRPTPTLDVIGVSPLMNVSTPFNFPFELGLDYYGFPLPDTSFHTTWNNIDGELWEHHHNKELNNIENKVPKIYGVVKCGNERSLLTSMMAVWNVQMITEVTRQAIHRIGPLHWNEQPTRWSLLRVYIFIAVELCVLGRKYYSVDGMTESRGFDKAVKFLCPDWYQKLHTQKKRHLDIYLPYKMYRQMRCSFFIDHTHFSSVSESFRNLLRYSGSYLCADEKLFYCSQDIPHKFICPSKPTGEGLWMYELTCWLKGDHPFLIDMEMRKRSDNGEPVPVHKIVEHWVEVCNSHNSENKCPKSKILTFDGFYASAATIELMKTYAVDKLPFKTFFCCGTRRPKGLKEMMIENHLSEGLFQRDKDSIMFHCGRYSASNGKKIAATSASNAFLVTEKASTQPQNPFHFYHDHFSLCDRFNRQLSDIHFVVHRSLPASRVSESREHDYCFYSTALNLWNLHKALPFEDIPKNLTLHQFLMEMGKKLYEHVLEIKDDLDMMFDFETQLHD